MSGESEANEGFEAETHATTDKFDSSTAMEQKDQLRWPTKLNFPGLKARAEVPASLMLHQKATVVPVDNHTDQSDLDPGLAYSGILQSGGESHRDQIRNKGPTDPRASPLKNLQEKTAGASQVYGKSALLASG